MKWILICSFLVFGFAVSKAQTIEGNNDCTYSKEIIIPFNYSTDAVSNSKPQLNQTVFYSYRDQFSYWYKVIAKENATLHFKVNSINDSDEYVVYVYQYNEKDFCDKVYYHKVKAVKSSFFINTTSSDDPYDLSEKIFQAKKDNVYYISVLNTSLNNCGHNFYLITQKDTLRIKAIHLPCKRDIATLSAKKNALTTPIKQPEVVVAKIIEPPIVKKDTVKVIPTNTVTTLVCRIIDVTKKTPIDAMLLVTEQSSNEQIQITQTTKGIWSCVVEKDKMYKIKCTAFGYKNAMQTVTIDSINNTVDILLQPFKEGENFVMKTIYFFPNTYALKKSSYDELQKLLQFLLSNQTVHIEIQGHTNGDHHIAKNKAYSKLGEEWNYEGSAKRLSQKRAEAIKNYLETNGITSERLEAKGYGGKKPIIKDAQTNEEGQLNIRVEVSILKS
ncbi:MAG: OmpA family protein [Bacteroidia bacterium]